MAKLDETLNVRIDSDLHQNIQAKADALGISDSDVVRLMLKHQAYSPIILGGWPDGVGERMLTEFLDGREQVRPLEALDIGSVVLYPPHTGSLFTLSGRFQTKDGGLLCTLRPLEPGGQTRKLDDGTYVEILARLDERLPVTLLRPNDFELRVISALAGGARDAKTLYTLSHARRDFAVAEQRVSLSVVGPFIGRLLSSLVAHGLIEFSGRNPLEAAWQLSERGRALAQTMKLEVNDYE